MKISKDHFSHIANIAKLTFTEYEEEQLLKDLKKEIDFIDTMNQTDTDDIEPMTYVHPIKNVFRDDIVTNHNESINVPDEFYVVPKTIE